MERGASAKERNDSSGFAVLGRLRGDAVEEPKGRKAPEVVLKPMRIGKRSSRRAARKAVFAARAQRKMERRNK